MKWKGWGKEVRGRRHSDLAFRIGGVHDAVARAKAACGARSEEDGDNSQIG